jgi:hypothetical protein
MHPERLRATRPFLLGEVGRRIRHPFGPCRCRITVDRALAHHRADHWAWQSGAYLACGWTVIGAGAPLGRDLFSPWQWLRFFARWLRPYALFSFPVASNPSADGPAAAAFACALRDEPDIGPEAAREISDIGQEDESNFQGRSGHQPRPEPDFLGGRLQSAFAQGANIISERIYLQRRIKPQHSAWAYEPKADDLQIGRGTVHGLCGKSEAAGAGFVTPSHGRDLKIVLGESVPYALGNAQDRPQQRRFPHFDNLASRPWLCHRPGLGV